MNNGNFNSNGTSNGAPENKFAKNSASEQAFRTLRHFIADVSEITGLENFYKMVHYMASSTEDVFAIIVGVGDRFGYSFHKITLQRSEVRKSDAKRYVVRYNGDIHYVTSIGRSWKLKNLGTGQAITIKAEELFDAHGSIEILRFEGKIGGYIGASNPHIQEDENTNGSLSSQILSKLMFLLKNEKKDVWVVVAYSIIVGLMSLIVPLLSQGIVNAVSLGVFTTQLVVLCSFAFLGLAFLGILSVVESYIVEVLKQRIFVKSAFEIAYRLPHIRRSSIDNEYAPELVNRFFDVLTVQKVLGKFLLDGVSAVLIAIVGLLLLALYHPFFIVFDIFIIIFAILLITVFAHGGLEASVKESKKKYLMAQCLEEVARCMMSFKLFGTTDYVFERVNTIAHDYVKSRRKHFRVVLRQLSAFVLFKALALAGILGLGGMLVIQQQVSIGQLVAAELVVFAMLGASEKIVYQFEEYYDLLTAVDKISHITDKPLEVNFGEPNFESNASASVRFHNVAFRHPLGTPQVSDIDIEIEAGSHVAIVGKNGSGKTTIAELLLRLYDVQHGSIEIDGFDIRRLDLYTLRNVVGIVMKTDEIFVGSIEENILLGRDVTNEQLMWAIKVAQLEDDILDLPEGLQTAIHPVATNISQGLLRRIMFARAIVSKPPVLVLDEAFNGLEEFLKFRLIKALYEEKCWTIIAITQEGELIRRADRVLILHEGVLVGQGSLSSIIDEDQPIFTQLFPVLIEQARKGYC